MIIPPLMGLLVLALTTVYDFAVNTAALLLGARLLSLEKKGAKTALLTAGVFTMVYGTLFTLAYLTGIFSELASVILVYGSILASTVLLMPLIKVFYKTSWKTALATWLLVLGANTVIHTLLSLALVLLVTAASLIMS